MKEDEPKLNWQQKVILTLLIIAPFAFLSYIKSKRVTNDEKPLSQLDSFKDQLQLAIKEERYEDAAILRDKINDILVNEKVERL